MTASDDTVQMPTHAPPKFLVVEESVVFDTMYHDFEDGEAALKKARELAARAPGTFIDIYQHATAIRKSE